MNVMPEDQQPAKCRPKQATGRGRHAKVIDSSADNTLLASDDALICSIEIALLGMMPRRDPRLAKSWRGDYGAWKI
jgi:hypothetical protein